MTKEQIRILSKIKKLNSSRFKGMKVVEYDPNAPMMEPLSLPSELRAEFLKVFPLKGNRADD